ncbi:splicing factor 1-like isoform X1 [Centruroides vittatus]|uniref:splicing factor 1-like isoform X1 n=1 Tax=Centruroides vittatus TaxID=120091 RepID=UPI0035109A7C
MSGKRDRDSDYDSHQRCTGSLSNVPDFTGLTKMAAVHAQKPVHQGYYAESTNWPPDMPDRRKKRRSRWGGDDKDKVFIPGMPTVLPNNLSGNQERAYLLQLQIEEISRRLRTGDLGIPPNPEDRSPSPEPIYNSEGKRLNTREYRTRKRLEDERHTLIQEMYKFNTDFKPPADYKPPLVKVSEKVMIPQEEHPDINFVGLLIGPRGNTLKAMEKETGAKIIIRGKGSVKEGKVGRKDGQPLPGEDEPLHAFVTANNPESVKKAVDKIKEIIRQGVEVPEGQNDLRRMQLRELALLNGTLRENDGPRCTNCGSSTHRSWQCPDKPNVTNNVICTNCGGAGHIARDCREKKAVPGQFVSTEKSKIDEEYMSLMAELGEAPLPPPKTTPTATFHTTTTLVAAPGIPRPVMPPPSSQTTQPTVSAPIGWTGNAAKPPGMIAATPPPIQAQPPGMMPPPPPGMGPHGLAPLHPQPGMMQWPQPPQPPTSVATSAAVGTLAQPTLGLQAVPPPPQLLAQPPPPPPPPNSQPPIPSTLPWLAPQPTQGVTAASVAPWQPQQPPAMVTAPLPVPPPPAPVFPWGGYVGVPPPPPAQPTMPPGLGIPPPPPPGSTPLPPATAAAVTTTATSSAQSVDLTVLAQAVPTLLAAPPPPPPS